MSVYSLDDPIDLSHALGSALRAIVDAQAEAARSSIELLNDPFFVDAGPEGTLRLRTTRFEYTKLDENQKRAEFVTTIPLLSLVHLPVITIRKATIDMDYEVVSSSRAKKGLMGRILKRRLDDTKSAGGLNVHIEVSGESLPAGFERLLELTELSVAEKKRDDSTE